MTDRPPSYPPPPDGYGQPPPGDFGQPPPGYFGQPPPGDHGYPVPSPLGEFDYSPPEITPVLRAGGTNKRAIRSLQWSVFGLITCGIMAIPGIISGFIALKQIKRTGEGGRGLAIAGIIVGAVILFMSPAIISLTL